MKISKALFAKYEVPRIKCSLIGKKEIFRNVDKDSYHILVLIAQKAKMNSVFNDQCVNQIEN